jgi:hypothetical protein
VAEVEPEYPTPSTWADDLGALTLVSHQVPRVGYDLSSMPTSRLATQTTASAVFQSQVNPYQE